MFNRKSLKWVGILLVAAIGLTVGSTALTTKAAPADHPEQGGAASKAKDPLDVKDISLVQAQAIIDAAKKKAEELKINEDIAIVDAGGNLKAFVRMDTAWIGSIDIAIKKAKTSRYFDMPSGDIGKQAQPGGPLYHIEFSNHGLITFPGGRPLYDASDHVIGAIGASGSTVENDDSVAQAGAAAIK